MYRGLLWIALGIWSLGSWWYYTCRIKNFCISDQLGPAAAEPAQEPASTPPGTYPLAFRYNDAEPIRGPGFEALLDSMKTCLDAGGSIVITGQNEKAERLPAGTGKGSRAESISALLASLGHADHIKLEQETISVWPGSDTAAFPAYRWRCEAAAAEPPPVEASVEESLEGAIIYFPSGSDQKLNNKEVDAYLQKLAAHLKKGGGKIRITGHSDAVGAEDKNKALAMQRAETVKGLLQALGVGAGQISVDSQGESQPIADNNSDAGRAKNRRAEIVLQ